MTSVFNTFGLGPRPTSAMRGGGVELVGKIGMVMGKPAAYAMNGTGRDTYISVDNGGFSAPFAPSFTPETGSFGSRRLAFRDSTMAHLDAKHTNYSSNGTGRDSYIR